MGSPAAVAAPLEQSKQRIVAAPPPTKDWAEEMRRALRSAKDLRAAVGLPPRPTPSTDFPVLAPWPIVRRIRPGDENDPILKQLLSQPEEALKLPGFSPDPLDEQAASPTPGLIHKYAGRALLIATGACALHCRYCFRREFPYSEHASGRLRQALERIAQQPDLEEIILSGGDPLSLDDERFSQLVTQLENIAHVRTLRIHTRWPIAIPSRITQALIERLKTTSLRVITVVHTNHAAEIDADVRKALRQLQTTGPVLNQSVLLRDVNNNVAALRQLSDALFSAGVLPYYLHQLDPVNGAAHFSVPDTDALRLVQELRETTPGYLVPRLVREIPGERSKTPLPT